jgi:two-component system sensor histidine kinase KdpD
MQEVEEQVEEYMRDFRREGLDTSDAVLVAITHRPLAKTLLRRGWRMASGLHGEFHAVYVDTGEDLNANERANLEANLRLAEDLGAEVTRLESRNVAEALAAYVREKRITQVLVGQSRRSRWRSLAEARQRPPAATAPQRRYPRDRSAGASITLVLRPFRAL